MSGSKEVELVSAVLLYAVRCLAEGDHPALYSMRFGPREVEALRQMSLADLSRIETLRAHCLKVELNREVFWRMVGYLEQQRDTEAIQQAFVAADAPLEMVQTLFGMGSREYTRLRRTLTVTPGIGRPPAPSEALSNAVWAAWSKRVQAHGALPLPPQAYLAVHAETGASLRAVWILTRGWLDDADYGPLIASWCTQDADELA